MNATPTSRSFWRMLPGRTFVSLNKHRDYRLFFAAHLASAIGLWLENTALAWYVVDVTGSGTALGIMAVCRFGPFVAFGLLSGVVADRFDTRRLLIVTQIAALAGSGVLALLLFFHAPALWQVYLLSALAATALVFDTPARQAFTFKLVGRDEIANAIALNASIVSISRTVGPALAGVLIGAVGVAACFALNAATFAVVIVALLAIRTQKGLTKPRSAAKRVFRELTDGVKYALGDRQVRSVLAVIVILSMSFSFPVGLPLLAHEALNEDAMFFGLLSATFGAGAVSGGLLSATVGSSSWSGLVRSVALLGTALAFLAIRQTELFVLAMTFVTGACFTFWTSRTQTILQLATPDYLRGRVLSLQLLAFNAPNALGGVVTGGLADIGGIELALAAGVAGTLCVAVAGVATPRVAAGTRAGAESEDVSAPLADGGARPGRTASPSRR